MSSSVIAPAAIGERKASSIVRQAAIALKKAIADEAEAAIKAAAAAASAAAAAAKTVKAAKAAKTVKAAKASKALRVDSTPSDSPGAAVEDEDKDEDGDEDEDEDAVKKTAPISDCDAKTRGLILAAAHFEGDHSFSFEPMEAALETVSFSKAVKHFRTLGMKFNANKQESYRRLFVAYLATKNTKRINIDDKSMKEGGIGCDRMKTILRECSATIGTKKCDHVANILKLVKGFDAFVAVGEPSD